MSGPDRRGVLVSAAGAALMTAAPIGWRLDGELARAEEPSQSLVCSIQHVIDATKAGAFEAYARQWGTGAARCGGRVLGVFAPHDATGETALTLVAFASLADYETFEARMTIDPDAVAASRLAKAQRVILSESRAFSRCVG